MTSFCKLKDFDWSARITLASDKISGIRVPIVLLKLFLLLPNGTIEEKTLEFSQAELNDFLNNLKNAKVKIKEMFQES